MRILITGSGGFVGKNLTEKFGKQYDIKAPGSSELNLLDTAQTEEYLRENRFDSIIHCANTNSTRKKTTTSYDSLYGNLHMFFNLERCKDCYGKMYYFGSGAEYDMRYYIPDMPEDYFGTHIPSDPYGFSKYIMSKTCEQDNNIYDLRLFGIFGPYEEWERRFISNAICRALKGMDITIWKNVYFDYLWIDDLAELMKWFLTHEPRHKHYNVCRGRKNDLYSLACMVREILDIDCDIRITESGWKPEYTGSNRRLMEEKGGFCFTPMEKAIKELGAYYRDNIDLIDEEILRRENGA